MVFNLVSVIFSFLCLTSRVSTSNTPGSYPISALKFKIAYLKLITFSIFFFYVFRLKKHSAVLYPSHWPKDVFEGSKIQLSNEALEKLKLDFKASIKMLVKVVSIREIAIMTFLTDMKGLSAFFLGLFKVIFVFTHFA